MDIKIGDKDIVINTCGDAVYIDTFEEMLQRVKIVCSIKKGSFIYDRNLGVDTSCISYTDSLYKEKLEMIFKEATIDIGYDKLKVIDVDTQKNTATLCVWCCEKSGTVEVSING